MPTPAPALQAPDGGPLDLDALVEALSGQFAVSVGGKQAVRRTRLDTFDRRLRAAGLTLEHQTGSATERLVLSGPEVASTVVANVRNMTWPSLAGALPESPVRDAVAPVAGIRALLVVSDEKRRVRRLELRNEDEKTVARLELDEPAAASAGTAEISVQALRGYEDQARRATRLLQALGLKSVEDGGDRQPDEASSTAHIDRDAPATELLAMELGEFLGDARQPPRPARRSWTPSSCTTSASRCAGPGRRSSWDDPSCPRPCRVAGNQPSNGSACRDPWTSYQLGPHPPRWRGGSLLRMPTTLHRSPPTCDVGGRPSGGHSCAGSSPRGSSDWTATGK